ncbi:MAG TPA: EAL domain-containing protein, partial [Acidimicrobiia bacterium]|nr:EAL domain-containing protein [Acidimicrobiia bacterium]
DNEQLAIVTSIVDLGRNLGLGVVAEGVETPTAWSLLRDRGCPGAQGYYLSRPLPPDAFLAWLRDYEATRGAPEQQELPGAGISIDLGRAEEVVDTQVVLDGLT